MKNNISSVLKLPKLTELLYNEGALSPNMIAKKLHSDGRTVEKMVKALQQLAIIECKSLVISGRTYRTCNLSKNYRLILEKKTHLSKF